MDIQELIEIAASESVKTFFVSLERVIDEERQKAFEAGYDAGSLGWDCSTEWKRHIEGDD